MRVGAAAIFAAAACLVATGAGAARGGPSFHGNGDRRLPAFSVGVDSTLFWTNSGGRFSLVTAGIHGGVAASAARGWTYLRPGRYTLRVDAVGPWTIRVRSGVVAPRVLPGGRRGYSGNGGLELPPLVSGAGPLAWTNSGSVFQIYSEDVGGTGNVSSAAHRGSTHLDAGTHHLQVNAIGTWSVSWPAP